MATKIQSAKKKQSVLYYIWNQFKNRLIWACNNTNLHGFKFVADKDLSIISRLIFAIISCLSLGLCSYLILLQINDYSEQLIVTRIVSTSYPVWKFRFPSVTICNFNVVYKNNIKNLMNVVTSHGIKEEIFMDFLYNLSSLVSYDDNLGSVDHYKEIYDVLEENGYDVDRTMEELAQPCDNMVKNCFWQSSEIPCSKIIQKIRTNNGYCCSFNYYGRRILADSIITQIPRLNLRNRRRNFRGLFQGSYSNPGDGSSFFDNTFLTQDPENLNDTYMGFIGSNHGLRLLLDAEADQYVSSTKSSYGFNVLVQDGADYPDMSLTTNTLRTGQGMKVQVNPSIFVSSKSLRNTGFHQRQCFFEDEGDMKWSSIYSYKTCLSHCSGRAIYKLCGCIPFYYAMNSSKRMCTFFDESCLERNKHIYTTLHTVEQLVTGSNLIDIKNREGNEEKRDILEEEEEEDHIHCQCSPQCNERIFTVESNTYSITSIIGYEKNNLSVLNVFYGAANCFKTKRDVYYTWNRILAAVGGIFSLCLGGSIISIVECFYIIGRCIYNTYNENDTELNSRKVSKPTVTYININSSLGHDKKKKANSKTQMFIKAFGNP